MSLHQPHVFDSQSDSLPADHFLFTSESVGEGHPDKLCDQISDAILDTCLKIDSDAKVNCEVSAKRNKFYILGEMNVKGHIDIPELVKEAVNTVGFNDR